MTRYSVKASIVENKDSAAAAKKLAQTSRSYGLKKPASKPVDTTIILKPDNPSDHHKDSDRGFPDGFIPDITFGTSHLVGYL